MSTATSRNEQESPATSVTRSATATLASSTILAAGLLLSVLAYLRTVAAGLRPLGPDLFGYIWQTRVVGDIPLSSIEARPGVPVLGAVLSGLGLTSDTSAALIVAPVMVVALGFATAATLRLAFNLPGWTVGTIGLVVALWGGSVHLAQGHLANLLSLVCIVPAIALLVIPAGSHGLRLMGAGAIITASGFAHAGFLPFYGAVAGLWFLLSVRSLVGARRVGARWWHEPSSSFLLALLASTSLVAGVLFGALGLSIEDFTNIDEGFTDFGNRLAQVRQQTGLRVSVATLLAVAGVATVWRVSRRSSHALTLLGIAWIAVCVVGWFAATIEPSVPGHRALGMILPLPALTGLGIVGAAMAIGARIVGTTGWRVWVGVTRGMAAACAIGVLGVLVISPGLERVEKRANREPKAEMARTIASYVAALDPGVPVVVFTDPPRQLAALSWRGRQNQIRALAPTESIDRIFVVVGQIGPDGLPEPTVAPENAENEAFTFAVSESWSSGGEAVRGESVILVPRSYVREALWSSLSARPGSVVLPDLAVLRGPSTGPASLVPESHVPTDQAQIQVLGCLVALGLLGGGYGAAVVWGRGGSVVDAIAIAPSIGAVMIVTIGVFVALLGADPAGVGGLVILVLGASSGYLAAWRAARTRTGRHMSGRPIEPPAQPAN